MDARWYVVNVHSGCEKKVAESIKEQAVLKKMEDRIFDVMIPTEQIVEVKKQLTASQVRKRQNAPCNTQTVSARCILTQCRQHIKLFFVCQ